MTYIVVFLVGTVAGSILQMAWDTYCDTHDEW